MVFSSPATIRQMAVHPWIPLMLLILQKRVRGGSKMLLDCPLDQERLGRYTGILVAVVFVIML